MTKEAAYWPGGHEQDREMTIQGPKKCNNLTNTKKKHIFSQYSIYVGIPATGPVQTVVAWLVALVKISGRPAQQAYVLIVRKGTRKGGRLEVTVEP